jgi:hypothetical protein
MRNHPIRWEKVYAVHARAQEVQQEAQQVRWQAKQTQEEAWITRLARFMPGSNRLTLALTALILSQRGLMAGASSPFTDRGPAPPRSELSARSSKRSPQA